jgi:putative addiction module CopG family antidote
MQSLADPLASRRPCANLRRMDGLRISLSDRQQAFVEAQVASGAFADASGYLASLIRADEKAKAEERLDALLQAALDELSEEDEGWTSELPDRLGPATGGDGA